MKALITGSAGFVGRHISAELISRGWDVEGWDITEGSDARIVFAAERHFTAYDLIVHCAFHVGGRAAIDGDRTALAKNLELDAALFGWAVRTRQKRILYFSSSAAYPVMMQDGSMPGYRLREDDFMRFFDGDSPLDYWAPWPDADYGFAKMTGERLADNARRSGINVHVVRPFSGVGEDQDFNYPFPAIIRRAQNEEYTVWGPPGQTRDLVHISDLVRIALAVVDADCQTAVNLCSGESTEFGDLMKLAARQAHGKEIPVEYLHDKPTGVMHRVGDPSLMNQFGKPVISVEEMVCRALKLIS